MLAPWISNGAVVIPAGATVYGHVERATSVGMGIVHEIAQLDLAFDDFVTLDGQRFPLHARLEAIDNSREQVTPQGTIRGVIAARHPNQLLFGVWSSPSASMVSNSLMGLTGISRQISSALSLGPIGQGGLLALRFAAFRFPEPEIQLQPGTDMLLRVHSPQPGVAEAPPQPAPAPPAVAEWLRKEPFTVHRNDKSPVGDIVNLAFLGSREQLINSFSNAGWDQADAHKSVKKMYYAYSSMRAYATAPVSALFYKGVLPGLVFQKSLNTIDKRHHIRVWYAGVVNGNELWLGAATHDTGIAFSRRSFTFTHKIDPNIDAEREKVVTDLRFSGCAEPEMRIDREGAVSSALTGSISTDGAAAVLPLNDCQHDGTFDPAKFDKPGNQTSRLARRFILESRNHVFRENLYYWTFQYFKHRHNRHVSLAAASTVQEPLP